jgi:hypothetical protein
VTINFFRLCGESVSKNLPEQNSLRFFQNRLRLFLKAAFFQPIDNQKFVIGCGESKYKLMSQALAESKSTGQKLAGKYLTFTLHEESYGIDVLKIREITKLTNITVVPQMPAYICGVINLRGKIIPVIDLRQRFGFERIENTTQTCIVVVLVKLRGGKQTQRRAWASLLSLMKFAISPNARLRRRKKLLPRSKVPSPKPAKASRSAPRFR